MSSSPPFVPPGAVVVDGEMIEEDGETERGPGGGRESRRSSGRVEESEGCRES